MDQQKINKTNDPKNAMKSQQNVHSNDRKMKQDFPGYPHHPANEENLNDKRNWKTDFSNESNTTATGSESVRDERPSEKDSEVKDEESKAFLKGNDRGMLLHDEDPGDVENTDAKSKGKEK